MAKVLVVGSGGREHALGWKLSRSPEVHQVIAAPGNDGMPAAWERWPVDLANGKPEFTALAKKAEAAGIDLAVIGPDNPLADGIVDVFDEIGVLAFGPSAKAARIESSKAFSKEVMRAAGVPTAQFTVVNTYADAKRFLEAAEWGSSADPKGWVVKADGLAFGKGVRVCSRLDEALEASKELIDVSGSLVIEERLTGQEISWMAFCDGRRAALLEPARDYKPLLDGNKGPNTGGMGAFSPVPECQSPEFFDRVRKEVFEPVLKEMAKREAPFKGVLYAGLMHDASTDRLWVLEFNARFGDPETQVLLPRMSDDLYRWCHASAKGDLAGLPADVPFSKDRAVVVVAAAKGYPEDAEKGTLIPGLQTELSKSGDEAAYFVAGVEGSEFRTSGGRVLGAVGLAPTFEAARERAYQRLEKVKFEGMRFRKDIARGLVE